MDAGTGPSVLPWRCATTPSPSSPTTGSSTSSSASCTRSIRSIAPEVAVIDLTHEHPALRRAGGRPRPRPQRPVPLPRASCWRWSIPASAPSVGPSPSRSATACRCSSGPTTGCWRPAVALVRRRHPGRRAHQPRLPAPRARRPPSPVATSSPPPPPTCASGVDLAELGPPIDPIWLFPAMVPISHSRRTGALAAEVLWVDRYGNAQLNVDPDEHRGLRATTCAALRRRAAHAPSGSPPSPRSAPARSASSSTPTGCCRSWSTGVSAAYELGLQAGTEVDPRGIRRRAGRAAGSAPASRPRPDAATPEEPP